MITLACTFEKLCREAHRVLRRLLKCFCTVNLSGCINIQLGLDTVHSTAARWCVRSFCSQPHIEMMRSTAETSGLMKANACGKPLCRMGCVYQSIIQLPQLRFCMEKKQSWHNLECHPVLPLHNYCFKSSHQQHSLHSNTECKSSGLIYRDHMNEGAPSFV